MLCHHALFIVACMLELSTRKRADFAPDFWPAFQSIESFWKLNDADVSNVNIDTTGTRAILAGG
jgi:hypothetical protein